MSTDEIVRTTMYVFLIPGLAYLGVRVWNAAMMPEMLRRPIATILWLQSGIYTLFMVGLILLRFAHPLSGLVWLNTALIFLQALLVLRVLWRIYNRSLRLILLVLVAVLVLFT